MKTPLTASLLVLAACAVMSAQETSPKSKRARTETEDVISHLEFPGGNLRSFVDVLREAAGSPLNIVLDEDAEAVSLPAIKLVNVNVSAALKVAQGAVKGLAKVAVQRIGEGPGGQDVFVLRVELPPPPQVAGSGGDTFEAALAGGGLPGAWPRQPQRLEVISLASIDERSKPLDTVLSAIQEAMSLSGQEGDRPTFKFHADSGLLMIRGTEEHIQVVGKVIQELAAKPGDPIVLDYGGAGGGGVTELLRKLEAEVAQLRSECAALRGQLDELLRTQPDKPSPKPAAK